jgi:hypothetical protein
MERRAFRVSGFVLLAVLLLGVVGVAVAVAALPEDTAGGLVVALCLLAAVILTVRHLATSYPYESHDDGRASLREGNLVSEELTAELGERAALAGVEVLESRITHLAYAPEIAQAMLARQQASAVVGARFKIVEGAVGMVQSAPERLRELEVVELDEERKAQMVANLLVVLCGDRNVQPVVNTGTLYG